MEQIGFEVAAFYRVLPDTLDRRAVRWVLRQFEQIQVQQRAQLQLLITVTEIGVGRAIARAFGSDVPPLEIEHPTAPTEPWTPPAWMQKFEEANKNN